MAYFSQSSSKFNLVDQILFLICILNFNLSFHGLHHATIFALFSLVEEKTIKIVGHMVILIFNTTASLCNIVIFHPTDKRHLTVFNQVHTGIAYSFRQCGTNASVLKRKYFLRAKRDCITYLVTFTEN